MHEAGRQEAIRLRERYTHWQAERPRKLDSWSVPDTELSEQAKAVGLCSATIDSEAVIFVSGESAEQVEGLVFGSPSTNWLGSVRSYGFKLEATSTEGVWRFSYQRPNPSIERTCPGKPGHASHLKR